MQKLMEVVCRMWLSPFPNHTFILVSGWWISIKTTTTTKVPRSLRQLSPIQKHIWSWFTVFFLPLAFKEWETSSWHQLRFTMNNTYFLSLILLLAQDEISTEQWYTFAQLLLKNVSFEEAELWCSVHCFCTTAINL